MAKKQSEKKVTKSDFLRKALGKNPDLDYRQINQRWAKAGHPGEISNSLYYKVREELGIKTEWTWVQMPEPAAGPKTAAATGEVYQFKITLQDLRPPIWRRIQVTDCTLDTLHEHIQTAMGWTNSHLHQFTINGKRFSAPTPMSEAFDEMEDADSTTIMLSDILPEGGKRFRFEYEYDFGDGWRHEIVFEGHLRAEPGKKYPLCVEGARACPPEDVGGVWGYVDFLEAISDPENEQHKEMRQWVGRKFDPEAFNPSAATRRMKGGLPGW